MTVYNSSKFNLTNWDLTLPVNSTGGNTGLPATILDITNYQNQNYFYNAPDGSMVFNAITNGAVTANTHFARSELRELSAPSKLAAWSLQDGGTMTATLKILTAPKLTNGNVDGMIIGQVHGQSDELVRIFWQNGAVYFKNNKPIDSHPQEYQLVNKVGKTPVVSIGQVFSYKIDIRNNILTVSVYIGTDEYTSVTTIGPSWQSDKFYFKAGVYLLVNSDNGPTGTGSAAFYKFDSSHVVGQGLGGLPTVIPSTIVITGKTTGLNVDNFVVGESKLDITDIIKLQTTPTGHLGLYIKGVLYAVFNTNSDVLTTTPLSQLLL